MFVRSKMRPPKIFFFLELIESFDPTLTVLFIRGSLEPSSWSKFVAALPPIGPSRARGPQVAS